VALQNSFFIACTMAELDFTHIKEVALAVKTLQTKVTEQEFSDLLIQSKMLADNSVEVIKMIAKLGWIELAVQFKVSIHDSLVAARDVMQQNKNEERIASLQSALQSAGTTTVDIIKRVREHQLSN
jgi:ribosomal protein L7/L12